jgi:hypothetical protein
MLHTRARSLLYQELDATIHEMLFLFHDSSSYLLEFVELARRKPSATWSKEQMILTSMVKLISNLDLSFVRKNGAQRSHIKRAGSPNNN